MSDDDIRKLHLRAMHSLQLCEYEIINCTHYVHNCLH